MKKYLLLLLSLYFLSCTQKKYDKPHLLIDTGYGEVEVELYPDKAPKTVAAFLSYVDGGMYRNGSFYRVMKNEDLQPEYNSGFIQGGIYKTNVRKFSTLKGTAHETTARSGLSHTDGILSMARTTPGSAKSEFFICIGDQRQFDSSGRANTDGLGFAAFGKVVKGMDVVRKIQSLKSNGDAIIEPASIKTISRL